METVQALSYIVLEEIVEGVIDFSVSPWPAADAEGRVRFDDLRARREIALDVAALRAELYDGWLARTPRVGDVFAAQLTDSARALLDAGGVALWDAPLGELLAGPVYDITVEARTVAKLAYFAATATVLSEPTARRWDLLSQSVADATPAPRTRVREAPDA